MNQTRYFAIIGIFGAALGAAQAQSDSGVINRGAGERSAPPTGAPPGSTGQSGPGNEVRDVPAANAPLRSSPETSGAPPRDTQSNVNSSDPTPQISPLGATGQTMPSTLSPDNAALDKLPIMTRGFIFDENQRKRILESIMADNKSAAQISNEIQPAMLLPEGVEMHELPGDLVRDMPSLSDRRYVRLNDRILIVNPNNRGIVGELAK